MAERSHEVVRTLNGGHRRRAEIARSLIHDPKVLLLDEATVGLDPETRKSITDDMHKKLPKQGVKQFCGQHICATKLMMTTSWSFYTMAKSLEMVRPVKL